MKKIYELKNQRAEILDAAEKVLDAQDMETYQAKMEEVEALNGKIQALEALEAEQEPLYWNYGHSWSDRRNH